MTSNSIKQEKKLNIELKNISKETTLDIIREHHYSNTLASINKEFLGIYINGELEGCITLGYGTRPKHTIKRMFPSLDTKNYLEIGRLCVSENYGNNTESQILSRVVKHLKKDHKEVKVLFTWANGMYGKPGFVYQASNFLYGGYIMSELYLVDGVQVHPRRIKQLISPNDKRKTIRPSPEQKYEYGIEHYKGKLFRYIYFLCGFSEKKRLLEESPYDWNLEHPKFEDCTFKKWVAPRKWIDCEMPVIRSDEYTDINQSQTTLEDFLC